MIQKATQAEIHMWTRLSYPLWHEPRPQVEFFDFVGTTLDRLVPFSVRSNFDEVKASGDRKSWIYWTFDGPINEAHRQRIQHVLEEHYEDVGKNFCWDGSSARTTLFVARAIGQHIQGTQGTW